MLVLAAVVVALSGGGRAGPARVSIEAGVPGRPVPSSFLGMSMEWPSVEPFAGPGRPDVVVLLRRIEAAARAPLALRVGGASAEEAWWNPSHRPRPPTIRHDIDPATLVAIDRLSRGLGAPVTVGLNLQLGDAANALALAQAAEARFGARLDGLEIGNEPDLYAVARTVGPPAVRRLRKRARYSPEDYVRDAGRYLDVLAARLPVRAHRPRLVIGGFAGRAGWAETLPTLIDAHPRAVGAIAGHRYGLSGCELGFDPAGIRSDLLQASASRGRMESLEPLVALAHDHRLPLRVAEVNSAPCGGAPGASDRFAAALWMTDALFALANTGADRADVHTFDGAVYAPFALRGPEAVPRPPFYGMLAFARAAPRGSRLVPVRVDDGDRVRAWATVDRGGTIRLALIAAVNARAVRVRVAVGAGRPCATVLVTSAPALAASTGIADRPARTVCPRGQTLPVEVPGPSLSVVTLPPRG